MRFQTKLFLVFAGFSLMVSILMLVFTMQSKKVILRDAAENRRNFARIVHISAQQLGGIPENRPEKIYQLIKELQSNEAVQEVTVVDRNQKVVASTNTALLGQTHPLSSMEAVINEKTGAITDTSAHFSLFEISVPIVREKRIAGLVRSTVILKDIRYPIEMLYYKSLLIMTLVLVVGFGSSLIILRRINKPLGQLSAAAERVAAGDLAARLKVITKDEIGKLGNAFNHMASKLEERKFLEEKIHSLERKAIVSEIASYLAHEIRNPLNLIVLTAHHMRKLITGPKESGESLTEAIDSLRDEVEHLNRMVSDFLDIGRASRLIKTEFSLRELINSVQILVRHRISSKQITLKQEMDPSIRLYADQEQMRLVFLNLIVNSAEAVRPGGGIWVKATMVGTGVSIHIVDNGPGIPVENLKKIFEPYFTQRTDGMGLGLSLVHRIVTEHGGKIEAANTETGGARFEIYLPKGD